MTILTLQIDNPSILAQLKNVLKSFHGVKIVDSVNNAYAFDDEAEEDTPNGTTLTAMKEIESGKDAGSVCMDNLESFIASMQ